MTTTRRFNTVTLRPHPLQWVINELILIVLCLLAWGYGGVEDSMFSNESVYAGLALLVILTYKYIALRRTVYTVSGEQFMRSEGVFIRNDEYIELYRVIDFSERKNLLQQLFGLKTVTLLSGDRTAPKLVVQGIKDNLDLVSIIRERVEYHKTCKPVYEITNRC